MSGSIILASKSLARRMVLENAGLEFTAVDSQVDEDEIKRNFAARNATISETAEALGFAKASVVSAEYPEDYVIGADQILELEGKGFDKPSSLKEAAKRLTLFAGKTHYLHTGVCVVRNRQKVWSYLDKPALTMRMLSSKEIDLYLNRAGNDILTSVGAYQLEGPGARLFSRIEGNYFSILGLPLLPLLDFLRAETLLEF